MRRGSFFPAHRRGDLYGIRCNGPVPDVREEETSVMFGSVIQEEGAEALVVGWHAAHDAHVGALGSSARRLVHDEPRAAVGGHAQIDGGSRLEIDAAVKQERRLAADAGRLVGDVSGAVVGMGRDIYGRPPRALVRPGGDAANGVGGKPFVGTKPYRQVVR